MLKKILQATLLAGLLSAGTGQAAEIGITGTIDAATGALLALYPPGTAFTGVLDWSGQLDGVQILLGGSCFTDDASGLPTTSATCGALGAVPILATDQTTYDGTAAATGSTFQQTTGTDFDGTSGVLNLLAFSSTFNVNIPISLTFDGSGGGTSFADGGFSGTASGPFTVNEVPVPAAAWLFISAIGGLGVVKRFKK